MSVGYQEFDDTPARVGLLLTIAPAAIAVAAAASTPPSLLVGAIGAVVAVAGVRAGSRGVVTIGAIGVFGGVVLAGVEGASILQVSVGAAAAIVAWDAGTNAVGVARQIGSAADTTRILVVHTVATSLVAAVIGVGGVAVYSFTRGGEPTSAVVLLLIAALAFVWLLDR